MPATKSYHLHAAVQATLSTSPANLPPVNSFTVALHDALFSGLFLQQAAAKRYISLHKATPPYRHGLHVKTGSPQMSALLSALLSILLSTLLHGIACWADACMLVGKLSMQHEI